MKTPTAEELVAQAVQAWRDETNPREYDKDAYEELWLAKRLADALRCIEWWREYADLQYERAVGGGLLKLDPALYARWVDLRRMLGLNTGKETT